MSRRWTRRGLTSASRCVCSSACSSMYPHACVHLSALVPAAPYARMPACTLQPTADHLGFAICFGLCVCIVHFALCARAWGRRGNAKINSFMEVVNHNIDSLIKWKNRRIPFDDAGECMPACLVAARCDAGVSAQALRTDAAVRSAAARVRDRVLASFYIQAVLSDVCRACCIKFDH